MQEQPRQIILPGLQLFYEHLPLGWIFCLAISGCKTQKQQKAGQQQVYQLEFPGKFHPMAVRGAGEAQGNEQGRIGGVEDVGETITEGKCQHGQLGVDAEMGGDGDQQGDQQERLGRTGADEEIQRQDQQIGRQNDGPLGQIFHASDGPVQEGVQNVGFRQGVLNGAGHEDQNHSREDADGTVAEALKDLFAVHSGENGSGEAANKEHQGHDDDGVILEDGDEAGAENQHHAGTDDGYEPNQRFGLSGVRLVVGKITGDGSGIHGFGVAEGECHQQAVNQQEGQGTQPQAGVHGKTCQILSNAHGEGVAQTGGKTTANSQQAHG